MPSGLAYKVHRRRVPSSVKLSTGTNVSPERALPNVSIGEVRTPRALHLRRENRTRRLRTEEHIPGRSRICTHPPARRSANAATNRRAGSRLPRSLALCGEAVSQVSVDPELAPPGRTGDPDASTEIMPSRGLHGLLIDVSLTRMLPPLWAPHLRDRSSTRPDGTEPLHFGDDSYLRSVSYRLDTPAPPAVSHL
jgi:hypothetical protein